MNGIPCSRHSFIAFGVTDDGMDAVEADHLNGLNHLSV